MNEKKLAIISIIVFVISLIIFITTIFFVFFYQKDEDKPKKVETYKVEIGEVSTNIGTSGRYFKGKITVESTDKKAEEKIQENIDQIRDYILQLIINQNIKDMMNEEGMNTIKGNIKHKIEEVIGEETITNVYFTDYIIQ